MRFHNYTFGVGAVQHFGIAPCRATLLCVGENDHCGVVQKLVVGPRMNETKSTFTFLNDREDMAQLWIEPWAVSCDVPKGTKVSIQVSSSPEQECQPVFEFSDTGATIGFWTTSKIKIFVNDVEYIDFSNLPVPGLPEVMRQFFKQFPPPVSGPLPKDASAVTLAETTKRAESRKTSARNRWKNFFSRFRR